MGLKNVFKKVTGAASDYGKLIVKSAVTPTEFVTKKAVYTPRYSTGVGQKLAIKQGQISGVTVPIAFTVAPAPVTKSIQTAGNIGGAVLPDKKPTIIPADKVPAKIPVYTTESPKTSQYDKVVGYVDKDADKMNLLPGETIDPEKLKALQNATSSNNFPNAVLKTIPTSSPGLQVQKPEFNYKPFLYTGLGLAALYGISKL